MQLASLRALAENHPDWRASSIQRFGKDGKHMDALSEWVEAHRMYPQRTRVNPNATEKEQHDARTEDALARFLNRLRAEKQAHPAHTRDQLAAWDLNIECNPEWVPHLSVSQKRFRAMVADVDAFILKYSRWPSLEVHDFDEEDCVEGGDASLAEVEYETRLCHAAMKIQDAKEEWQLRILGQSESFKETADFIRFQQRLRSSQEKYAGAQVADAPFELQAGDENVDHDPEESACDFAGVALDVESDEEEVGEVQAGVCAQGRAYSDLDVNVC